MSGAYAVLLAGRLDDALGTAPRSPGIENAATRGHLEVRGFRIDNDVDLRTDGGFSGVVRQRLLAHKLYPKTSLPADDVIASDFISLLLAAADAEPAAGPNAMVVGSDPTTDDSFVSWLGTLPFPLSVILWRYAGTVEASGRIAALFQFFEASAQFCSTIMLSAIHRDKALFARSRTDWRGQDGQPFDLTRSSFGLWVAFGYRIAKTLRGLLSTPAGEARCRELFAIQDVGFLRLLAQSQLFGLFERVSRRRNEWLGHGGQPGAQLNAERLRELEQELGTFWELWADAFQNKWLIVPRVGGRTGRRYSYTAELLVGSNPLFRLFLVSTEQELAIGALFLMEAEASGALPLLAFVKMIGAEGERGFYFFNRSQKNETRWICYHAFAQAEVVDDDRAPAELAASLISG